MHACVTGHAGSAERQVNLLFPWNYGRMKIMSPWYRYSPRLLSATLACVEVLAWGGIACTGVPNDGLPNQAQKSRKSNPTRLCRCVVLAGENKIPTNSCVSWLQMSKRTMVGSSMSATSQGSYGAPATSLRPPGELGRVGKALQLGHARPRASIPCPRAPMGGRLVVKEPYETDLAAVNVHASRP